MNLPTYTDGIPRYDMQLYIAKRIARLCSLLLPDDGGIHVRFINADVKWGKLNADDVHKNMNFVTPKGNTRIGYNLDHKVLEPYVYRNLETGLAAPYLVCVFTDGYPQGEDPHLFSQAVQKCAQILKQNGHGDNGKTIYTGCMVNHRKLLCWNVVVVSFVVCRIGNDDVSERFLDELQHDYQLSKGSVFICNSMCLY